MEQIKSLWIMLSWDAALICNEDAQAKEASSQLMSLDLLERIMAWASGRKIACHIVGSRDELPATYLASALQADEIILPVEYNGSLPNRSITFILESRQIALALRRPNASRVIVRVRTEDLPRLSEIVNPLLGRFQHIVLRHPEAPNYGVDELSTYATQLSLIGEELLGKGSEWMGWFVHPLTDCLMSNEQNSECGAGDIRFAVAPSGELYICPAAMRGGFASCGHIDSGINLPNRHLLTRHYSLPCPSCEALHCSRCVYQSKVQTHEFCAPAKNVCRLAFFEQEAKVRFLQEAVRRGVWPEGRPKPAAPTTYDSVVCEEDDGDVNTHFFDMARRFTGQPEHLHPLLMVQAIQYLRAHLRALCDCREVGCDISVDALANDPSIAARYQMLSPYLDTVFRPGTPTIRELMKKMATCVAEARQ